MRWIIAVTAVGIFATSTSVAQQPQRGTWELGGFGRFNWYANDFNVIDSTKRKNSWGGGIRIARFFAPKWALEFDASLNATDLDFPTATSIGVVYLPFHLGVNYETPLSQKFSWLVGPRINFNSYRTSNETSDFSDKEFEGTDWGIGAITGFRYKFSEMWSARLDGNIDYIPSPVFDENGSATMMGVQLGLSAFLGGKCRDKLDSIRVEPKTQTIMVGERANLRVSGIECDGEVVDLSGTSVAKVLTGAGAIAGLAFTGSQAGCTDIEVANPAARRRSTDTARICVQERPAPPPPRITLDRCELTPSSSTDVPPGETVTYRVTGFYSDGTSRDLPSATLTADRGTVTGRSYVVPTDPGTYTVVADCGEGRSARATVTVRAVSVTLRALFGFNRTTVANRAEIDSLRILADLLKQYPNVSLTIFGHTDWVGSVAYNERLGMRRIQAVLDTLTNYGIEKSRIDTWSKVSMGECQPLADNRTRDGRAQNRRVTIYDTRSAPVREGGGRCAERP